MGVTISTHNGSDVAREHNVRNSKVVSKEEHIDMTGDHEIWIDEPVRQAYERLFGEAVAKYNASQKRPERRIKNYYNNICNDIKKHPVYEMIIGVYGKNEDGSSICSVEEGKSIMKRFIETWHERNPNLELIGAYYHADEEGEPHVHIDYVPVAHGYIKGMETQTGLVKALGEQGIEKIGKATAQIQWEKRENDYLTNLCERIGLTVEHPKIEGREHLETEVLKLQKRVSELERAKKEAIEAEQRMKNALETAKKAEGRAEAAERKLEEINIQHKIAAQELKKVLDKKARASEIKRNIFDRETQTYHANMLEATRKIGEEAYREVLAAKEALEEAEKIKGEIEKKEKEITPLHQAAVKDKVIAARLKENEQKLIYSKARELADKHISEAFIEGAGERYSRLENYCKGLILKNGKNALESFNEREKALEQQIREKMKKFGREC